MIGKAINQALPQLAWFAQHRHEVANRYRVKIRSRLYQHFNA